MPTMMNLAMVSALVVSAGPLAAQPKPTSAIATHSVPATATVIALDANQDTIGQGSAFVVRPDGILITNYHVMRGASSAMVVLASKERFTRVKVLDADSSLDLAILKIPGAGLSVLPTRTTIPAVGEKVVVIGSPLGLVNTVTEGIVSATRIVDGRQLVQITAAISPGSSGGAVLDDQGRVFAVSTLYLEGGQTLNFAVPVRYALGLINDRPQERAIADVFARLSPEQASGVRQSGRTNNPDSVSAGYRRDRTPRKSVDGSYELWLQVYDSSGSNVAQHWGFLYATSKIGLLVLAQVRDSNTYGPTRIYGVTRWSTNDAADVVLSAGGFTYDGYQSDDDGFVAEAKVSDDKLGSYRFWLGAVPRRFPLSQNDGLYSVSTRTFYESRGRTGSDAVDWTGEMAVGFAAGTVYIDLYLSNSDGGTTSFYGFGPLTNESFDLKDKTGSRVKGTIRDGVIIAQWTDKRDDGAFVGRLHAERR